MKLSEFARRARELQEYVCDGGIPAIEDLIEISRPMGLDLHLIDKQELITMIVGINTGLDAVLDAYIYFDDEEE